MPQYNTVLGMLMMSERRGFFCRYGCEVAGKEWVVIPKSDASAEDQKKGIATRDAHEVQEHGKVFLVWKPEQSSFNTTFARKKAK